MDRKTVAIFAVAGGLVAAAAALGRTRSHPADMPHTPLEPRPLAGSCSLESAGASRASQDLGIGQLTAALSQGKLLRAGTGDVYMAVDVRMKDLASERRAKVNMAIVIDHSGSMAGDKIVQARAAARGIIEHLGPDDRVALIQYDDDAQVLVASTPMDEAGKRRMRQAIDGIVDDGGTNLNGGMQAGIDEAERAMGGDRITRVVLLSDGLATAGVTDPVAIAHTAQSAAEHGVRVTTIGLGVDYNEDLMEAIAESGRGQYYYVRDSASLETVFAGELRAMQGTVATAAELRVIPACGGVEIVEAYGWQSHKDGNALVVPLSDLAGGDARKVVLRVHAPVAAMGPAALARAELRFVDKTSGEERLAQLDLAVQVSADAADVKGSADPEVMVKVEEIEAARALRDASAAYDRGDREEASRIVRQQADATRAHAAEYDLPAAPAAAVMQNLDDMDKGINAGYAAGSADAKNVSKENKAKANTLAK